MQATTADCKFTKNSQSRESQVAKSMSIFHHPDENSMSARKNNQLMSDMVKTQSSQRVQTDPFHNSKPHIVNNHNIAPPPQTQARDEQTVTQSGYETRLVFKYKLVEYNSETLQHDTRPGRLPRPMRVWKSLGFRNGQPNYDT